MPRPRPMVSYAQNCEDVLLERVFADVEQGFYVDVGANDPDHCSLTRHFYNHGWRGINFEPGTIFEKLRQARPRDINLNIAVSASPGSLPFHEYPAASGLATLEAAPPDVRPELLAGAVTRTVPVRPLRDVFAELQPPPIDFLSVDVEGHERQVLLSNDWSRWRPRVLVIEAVLPARQVPSHQHWEDVVLAADYRFACFDGINRFYVRREDEALLPRLAAPANVLDEFIHCQTGGVHAEVVRLLQEREQVYLNVIDRLKGELAHLRRDTGTRSLDFGLWVARQMYRLTRRPRFLRRSA